MKKTSLLSILFILSILTVACKKDSDDQNPTNQNPAEVGDPEISIVITGDISETISFTIPGGIVTDHSIVSSYVGVSDLLTFNVMQLPTGFQFSLIGNRDSFGLGDFEASGDLGYGAYIDQAQNHSYIATSTTITFSSTTLIQDVVYESYSADGSFVSTMEDPDDPSKVIQVEGTFENIPLSVND